MKLEDAMIKVGVPGAQHLFDASWDESMAEYPKEGPSFLHEDEVIRNREWSGLPDAAEPDLITCARRIANDPALARLSWHCYRLLYESPDYNLMSQWPSLGILGELSGSFYLLIAMAMVPRVQKVHKKMGVSEEVSRDTCLQVSAFASNYARKAHGRLGIPMNQLYWLRHYTEGRLFRIGRFEYMIRPFNGGVEVYRNTKTGRVIALAPDGTLFNAAGYVIAEEQKETVGVWQATLRWEADAVYGYPISPRGYAVHKVAHLPTSEWECVLKKDDLKLDMHIPAGGGMSLERCGDSMRRAVPFFQNLFPDQPFQAITCASWIFNNQLEEVKLSSDNLVQYQRELYLYPVKSSGTDGLWFIFLQDKFDLTTAPRNTSLQKGVAAFLEAGNTWRGGGMFFLIKDLPHFGTQYYRSQWDHNQLSINDN